MDFTISQDALLGALTLANAVADRRAVGQPILGNVLLRASKDNTLTIVATDLTISVSLVMPVEVRRPGALTIGAKYLHQVVRTLPGGKPLAVTALENMWARIGVGRSEFKLMGQSPSDYPEVPTLPKGMAVAEVKADTIADLIEKTGFSVSADEARVNLSGVLLACDGKRATMVSTDGHRLTKLSLDMDGAPTFAHPIIIPRKGMLEIKRALDRIDGKIGIAVDGGVLYLRTADMVLSVKLSNVVFPPYEQVIPEQHDRLAVCDRAELLSVLTRAEVMAPEKTATVRLSITPGAVATMTITADNPDLGVASQVIDIEFTGDAIVAGFNAHYMIEVLSAMESERVRLEFQGELDPCVLRPVDGDDYLGVVMPMRI